MTTPIEASATVPAPSSDISETPTGNNSLDNTVAHLELLGYRIRPLEPSWLLAEHPYRYDLALCARLEGIRFYSAIPIGTSLGHAGTWADFLNNANNRAHFVRFSLDQDKAGVYEVRLRALVTGPYERRTFAVVMDRWHDDLELLERRPTTDSSTSGSSDEDLAEVTVH